MAWTLDLDLSAIARDLALDVVALVVLVYAVYYRRHRRWEAVVGYVAFNLSLFTVAAALVASSTLTFGVGFGLFAVLSIVRLRSDESNQAEIGYTMVALVLGLLLGLPGLGFEYKAIFAVVLVGAMFVVDHPRLTPAGRHRATVLVDEVVADPDEVRSLLSARLGGEIESCAIREIDYVRETMAVEVAWRTGPGGAPLGRDGFGVAGLAPDEPRRRLWRR